MKFLIVTADPGLIEVVTIALELWWPTARVFSAPDGAIGLPIFRRETPDLILVDASLPRTNGWEMLQQIRAVSPAPVILFTGRGDEPARARAQALGADDCLPKPFSHLELFARIQAVLRATKPPMCARPARPGTRVTRPVLP